MTLEFGITWDYRCPFARNVNEHILTALSAGADWKVSFSPFSLGQAHLGPADVSVWEDPGQDSGILALQVALYVRDNVTDKFLALHRSLFSARHEHGSRLTRAELVPVLENVGVDPQEVFAAVDSGTVLQQVEREHVGIVKSHSVWGVPTFIVGDQAAFVRLMTRSPEGSDPKDSARQIERIVQMLQDWPALNEFKHTTVER